MRSNNYKPHTYDSKNWDRTDPRYYKYMLQNDDVTDKGHLFLEHLTDPHYDDYHYSVYRVRRVYYQKALGQPIPKSSDIVIRDPMALHEAYLAIIDYLQAPGAQI